MHIMYVDESGDCGYPESGSFPLAGGPTRFFARAGLVVHAWQWRKLDRLVADFKRSRRLQWNDEIKAADVRAGKRAFAGWSQEKRKHFILDILESIRREMSVHLLVVAIAKKRVDLQQRERFRNPGVRSLELLLERYNGFLSGQKDKTGIVILDSVEARSDENLRYFQNYLLNFSEHLEQRRIVESTLFMPSHTSNLLQLADLCTNVAYRHFARVDGKAEEYERIAPCIAIEKVWPD